jgi:preprotein translocase subunit SecY
MTLSQTFKVVENPGWGFKLMTVLTLTTGTAFIMWLGEQITDRGIGNGMSLLIFAGIVVGFPKGLIDTFQMIQRGDLSLLAALFLVAMMVAVIAVIIFVERGQRRITVQYAKRMVGRRQYGGQSTHLPLRVNTSGVIPVIFASSIIAFPRPSLPSSGPTTPGCRRSPSSFSGGCPSTTSSTSPSSSSSATSTPPSCSTPTTWRRT